MASPAWDARLKVLETKPNAQVVERGRGWLSMYDPDSDKFIFQSQVEDIGWHYGQDFDQEVDTTWVYVGPGWEMNKAEYNATLQANTYTYIDPVSNKQVALTLTDVPQWVNDLGQRETAAGLQVVSPVASDDRITYDGILGAGTSLMIEAQTARLAKRLTVPSLSTFVTPTLTGTIYLSLNLRIATNADVYVDGVLWDSNSELSTANPIEFRDGQNTVFSFSVPFAIDSEGVQIDGTMTVRKAGNNLFAEVHIPYAWMQTAIYPIEIDPSVNPQVGAGADDGFEKQNDTGFDATGTIMYIVAAVGDFDRRDTFCRFSSVSVPNSATIDTAYVSVYASNAGFITMDADVYCEDVDNSVDLSTNADIVNRTRTTAYTTWEETVTASAFNNSPSIVSAVQEVVDRGGWSSGNAMSIYFRAHVASPNNYMEVRSYEGSTTNAAKLYIEYTLSTTLEQEGFRWRIDDGSESAATWAQDQDTNETMSKGDVRRLRVLVNATGNPDSKQYKLQCREEGTADPWQTIT